MIFIIILALNQFRVVDALTWKNAQRRRFERMVDIMEFMEKLQKQKEEAKAAYIKARNEWEETITAENIKGDFEKWKILCDRKADCRRLGVLI